MSQSICVLDAREEGAERVHLRRRRLRSHRAIRQALLATKRSEVWVLETERAVADLLDALPLVGSRVRHAMLICYATSARSSAQMIASKFSRTLMGASAMVPLPDLTEILAASHPEDYCVGADWDQANDLLAIWRGDLTTIVVRVSEFGERDGVSPEPGQLSVTDCGQTVRVGAYEVSVDAILYDRDPRYRRRAKKRMIASEQGLGPSIRRLRIRRGLSRGAFPGLDEKTLARIELGDVTRPQRRTLRKIAGRLGVTVEELDDY